MRKCLFLAVAAVRVCGAQAAGPFEGRGNMIRQSLDARSHPRVSPGGRRISLLSSQSLP